MYILNDTQIATLREMGLEYLVVANSYITYPSLITLPEEKISELMGKVGISGDYGTLLNNGLLADYPGFSEFLRTSEVLVFALRVGQTNVAIRKLIFELLFWLGHPVGTASPNTILATWDELNVLTKGQIARSISQKSLDDWNNAIDKFKLQKRFKLTK